MSSTSTNAVQNKVVNSALDGKLNISGGTINGTLKLTPEGIKSTTNQFQYFLGIENFSDGGEVKVALPSDLTIGNASRVNGHTVNSDVPSDAKFTDTTYGTVTSTSNGLVEPWMYVALLLSPTGATYQGAGLYDGQDVNDWYFCGTGVAHTHAEAQACKNLPSRSGGTLLCYNLLASDQRNQNPKAPWRIINQFYADTERRVFTRSCSNDSNGNHIGWSGWSRFLTTEYDNSVISWGTSGNWRYLKYNDGSAMCYGTFTLSRYGNPNIMLSGSDSSNMISLPITMTPTAVVANPATTHENNTNYLSENVKCSWSGSRIVLSLQNPKDIYSSSTSIPVSVVVFGHT